MSSIIKGYNYNLFLNFHQSDNEGYGGVSEFVAALQDELTILN